VYAKEYAKEYRQLNAKYEIYKDQLTIDEDPRLAENDISIEVKCKNCKEYFIPTNQQVSSRIQSLNGTQLGEHSLYCSEECKQACPVYYKQD
jgi:hypothetical protein